jgi:hypothetical protein
MKDARDVIGRLYRPDDGARIALLSRSPARPKPSVLNSVIDQVPP